MYLAKSVTTTNERNLSEKQSNFTLFYPQFIALHYFGEKIVKP